MLYQASFTCPEEIVLEYQEGSPLCETLKSQSYLEMRQLGGGYSSLSWVERCYFSAWELSKCCWLVFAKLSELMLLLRFGKQLPWKPMYKESSRERGPSGTYWVIRQLCLKLVHL